VGRKPIGIGEKAMTATELAETIRLANEQRGGTPPRDKAG
jgi:hypothetical protein